MKCLLFLLPLLRVTIGTAVNPPALSTWMGDLEPIIGNLTLFDLSLPGTHDTLTYDLSTTVADNANDLPAWAAWFLHTIHGSGFIGQFIRKQAVTQELNVTEQLQAGMRFLDLRTIYTAPPTKPIGSKDWYSLHMVESNQPSLHYFTAVAEFLRDHPKEIVVMMLTRHGCEQCTGIDQYPGATNANKQLFWQQIKQIFATAGVGFVPSAGTNYTSPNSTSVSELMASNRRALLYAGDYKNFTNTDPLAWDGNYVFNGAAGENVANLPQSVQGWDQFYRNNAQQRADLKAANKLYLMSLAGSPPSAITQYAAEIYAVEKIGLPAPSALLKKCAASMNIPNVTEWCPRTLNEWERLRNFYSQIFLDRIVQPKYLNVYSPPGAIYLDVVGKHGEIRTDTQALDHEGFSYVDTLLLWNVRRACRGKVHASCLAVDAALVERRKEYKLMRWDDASSGRHSKWPIGYPATYPAMEPAMEPATEPATEPAPTSPITWTDWDKRQTCSPTLGLHQPSSIAEVIQIIQTAAASSQQVKVVGSGHSFSPITLTDNGTNKPGGSIMLNLDRINTVLMLPTPTHLYVTVEAGIRVHDLNAQLLKAGYGLKNTGAIAQQSIAGATQTGTHGTGSNLGSMSSTLTSMDVLLANGTVVTCSMQAHMQLFQAARVGLGALGIVLRVTVQVVPKYKLHRIAMPYPLDQLAQDLPALTARYERLQWYYTPYTNNATLLLRLPIAVDAPIVPCWPGDVEKSIRLGQNVSCVDWSFKALCHEADDHILYTGKKSCAVGCGLRAACCCLLSTTVACLFVCFSNGCVSFSLSVCFYILLSFTT